MRRDIKAHHHRHERGRRGDARHGDLNLAGTRTGQAGDHAGGEHARRRARGTRAHRPLREAPMHRARRGAIGPWGSGLGFQKTRRRSSVHRRRRSGVSRADDQPRRFQKQTAEQRQLQGPQPRLSRSVQRSKPAGRLRRTTAGDGGDHALQPIRQRHRRAELSRGRVGG